MFACEEAMSVEYQAIIEAGVRDCNSTTRLWRQAGGT